MTDNGIGEADLKKSIEWVESVGTRLSEKAKSISKCIGDQLKNITKSNIDGFKTLDRLRSISLAILPATCWMLNKIYPWFMDKAFLIYQTKQPQLKERKIITRK